LGIVSTNHTININSIYGDRFRRRLLLVMDPLHDAY